MKLSTAVLFSALVALSGSSGACFAEATAAKPQEAPQTPAPKAVAPHPAAPQAQADAVQPASGQAVAAAEPVATPPVPADSTPAPAKPAPATKSRSFNKSAPSNAPVPPAPPKGEIASPDDTIGGLPGAKQATADKQP
jgi:hypothetical protein